MSFHVQPELEAILATSPVDAFVNAVPMVEQIMPRAGRPLLLVDTLSEAAEAPSRVWRRFLLRDASQFLRLARRDWAQCRLHLLATTDEGALQLTRCRAIRTRTTASLSLRTDSLLFETDAGYILEGGQPTSNVEAPESARLVWSDPMACTSPSRM